MGVEYGFTDIYKFGDTIEVNNKVYKKLWVTRDSMLTNFEYTGTAFREEETRIYKYVENENTEKQVYDFSLEQGDTVFHEGYEYYTLEANQIDTITLNNGDQRKRIKLNLINQVFYFTEWIDGIGSVRNVFSPRGDFLIDVSFNLLCFTENDTIRYSNSEQEDCYKNYTIFSTNQREELEKVRWKVYPTIIENDVIIENNQIQNLNQIEFQLINLSGQIILKERITKQAKINLRGRFENGLYIYQIREDREIIQIGKLIIK